MHRKLIALAAAVSMVLLVSGVAAASITLFEPPLFHLGSVNGQSGVGGGAWKSAPLGAIPACVPTPTIRTVRPGGRRQHCRSSWRASWVRQSIVAYVERMWRLVSSSTRRIPHRSYNRSARRGPIRCSLRRVLVYVHDARPPARTVLERQPGLRRGLAHVLGGPGRHPGRYSGQRQRHPRRRWRVRRAPWPDCLTAPVRTRSGSGSRSTRARTTTWCESLSTVEDLGQCFTTWENYYRTAPEQAPPPNRNTPATINSLQFRSSVPGPPALLGNGYLFDNVSITPSNGPGPPGCDVPIEKTADSPTVTAGGRAGYRITVRNRGRLAARNLRACDRIPRQMTFVSADRRLRRIGRQRCLTIPRLQPGQRVSFHLVLQVNANAPQGRVTNTGEVTPPPVTTPSPGPGSPASPGGPPAVIATPKPIAIAKAAVKIVKRAPAQRPAARPPFTG